MPDPATRGVVSISVDADTSSSPSAAARDDVLSVVVELLDRFHKHCIAGTWAFHDPAGTSLAARRITSDMPGQEVALLVAASASQGDLSRGEVLRTDRPAAAVGRGGGNFDHFVGRHGKLDAAAHRFANQAGHHHRPGSGFGNRPDKRRCRQGISKLDGVGAQAVCHGLWHVPVAISLHGGGWIANRIQLVRLVHQLNRAAARGGLCHVRIDAAAMAAGDVPHGLRTMDRLLRHLDRLCHAAQHQHGNSARHGRATVAQRRQRAQSILRASLTASSLSSRRLSPLAQTCSRKVDQLRKNSTAPQTIMPMSMVLLALEPPNGMPKAKSSAKIKRSRAATSIPIMVKALGMQQLPRQFANDLL